MPPTHPRTLVPVDDVRCAFTQLGYAVVDGGRTRGTRLINRMLRAGHATPPSAEAWKYRARARARER
jgi:hypothetical protein